MKRRSWINAVVIGMILVSSSNVEVTKEREIPEAPKKTEVVEVKKEVVQAPKPKEEVKPKPEPKKQTISRGGTMTLKTIKVVATAYTADTITAVGTKPETFKTVAVDPRVIPLGSLFYIDGFPNTIFLAEDTGGDIKGNRIDIFHKSKKWCLNTWGRRTVNVHIIKWGDNNVKKVKKESQSR